MVSKSPTNFADLFRFYDAYVKPLYSSVQINNQLPVEVLFELNAALDHISRHWVMTESESVVVEKAYSHLKRACLDIFKLKVKEATDQYNGLIKLDISIIDNGNFENNLHQLYAEIKAGAATARAKEGRSRDPDLAASAFDLWEPVYEKCVRLQKDFYENTNVNWSYKITRQKESRRFWKEMFGAFAIGVLITVGFWYLTQKGYLTIPHHSHTTGPPGKVGPAPVIENHP